ncbi:MAG: hypothetical protein SVU32_04560 [Candidatus Nanohaloarchaea archaeon]|nr:hypothetical protein [Candidatus Nanohaloarchaea archaeon]
MAFSDMPGKALGLITDTGKEHFNGFIEPETCREILHDADTVEVTEHAYDESDQKKKDPTIDDTWAEPGEEYETTPAHTRLIYKEHSDTLELDTGFIWYEQDEEEPVRPEGGYSITATFEADTETADAYSEMLEEESVSYSPNARFEGRNARGIAAGATLGAGAGFATFGPAGAVPWGFIGAVTGDRISKRLYGEQLELLDLATRVEINSTRNED